MEHSPVYLFNKSKPDPSRSVPSTHEWHRADTLEFTRLQFGDHHERSVLFQRSVQVDCELSRAHLFQNSRVVCIKLTDINKFLPVSLSIFINKVTLVLFVSD